MRLSMVIIVALSGCFSSTSPTPVEEGTKDDVASADAETPEGAAPAPAGEPSQDRIPMGKGRDYSGRWLVILSSKKELGHVPEGLAKLTASGIAATPVRLQSSAFKKLQPCYEIVVADAFDDRKAAVAYSEQLTAAGIDNYPKQPGAWAGIPEGVAAYCAGERDPAPTACPGDLRLANVVGGKLFMETGLDEAAAARVIEPLGVPTVKDGGAIRPITGETYGELTVGDTRVVHRRDGAPMTCTVAGFAGVNHADDLFGFEQCGEYTLRAELNCPAPVEDPRFAAPAGSSAVLGAPVSIEKTPEWSTALQADASWKSLAAQAATGSDGLGELVYEESHTFWTVGDRTVMMVHGKWFTGEGEAYCGGEDYLLSAVGAVVRGSDGTFGVWPMTEVDGLVVAEPVDVRGDGTLSVWANIGGTRYLLGTNGEPECHSPFHFCGCSC